MFWFEYILFVVGDMITQTHEFNTSGDILNTEILLSSSHQTHQHFFLKTDVYKLRRQKADEQMRLLHSPAVLMQQVYW